MSEDFPPPPAPAMAPYSPTDALSYGWNKFKADPAKILVPGLVWLIAVAAVEVIAQVILRATLLGTHDCTQDITAFGVTVNNVQTVCGPGFFTTLGADAIASFVTTVIISALGAGLIKLVLNAVDDKPVVIGEMFSVATQPAVLTTSALVALGTAVGTLLCFLPGIIFAVLASFAPYYVVDKDRAPVDAIKASFSFVTGHFGQLFLFYILAVVTIIVGAIACLVGLLVAIPVVYLAGGYTWRRLNNEPIAV